MDGWRRWTGTLPLPRPQPHTPYPRPLALGPGPCNLFAMRHGSNAAFGRWLWDLIPRRHKRPGKLRLQPIAPPVRPADLADPSRLARQHRYQQIVEQMKRRYGIRVRKWRSRTTGCAWQVEYADGTITRLIEAPFPRSPISAAVFLHEVGHHAIGFHRYKPRCLEELRAWEWALAAMRQHDIAVTDHVRRRVEASLKYAVAKAQRRGIKELPEELKRFAR